MEDRCRMSRSITVRHARTMLNEFCGKLAADIEPGIDSWYMASLLVARETANSCLILNTYSYLYEFPLDNHKELWCLQKQNHCTAAVCIWRLLLVPDKIKIQFLNQAQHRCSNISLQSWSSMGKLIHCRLNYSTVHVHDWIGCNKPFVSAIKLLVSFCIVYSGRHLSNLAV